jgi:low affinity Fe/Cu permease
MNDWFCKASRWTADAVGSPYAFLAALILVLAWLFSGPIFAFGTTWQLVINTFTTIITFLMVFLIQSAQDADTKSIHAKLDELILSIGEADNKVMEIERKGADALQEVQQKHEREQ